MASDSLPEALDTCDRCGHVFAPNRFEWPWCPHGTMGTPTYVQDDIPGGMVIENLGPTPVRVYSHSERRRLMKERGLEEFVRHAPLPGHDRSIHTTDWSKGSIDAKTLDNARVLVSRQRASVSATDTPDAPDHVVRPDGTAIRLHSGRVYKGLLDDESVDSSDG